MDACKQVIGGFVIQDSHVVHYELIKLKEHEKNYVTHDIDFFRNHTFIKYVATVPHRKNFFANVR